MVEVRLVQCSATEPDERREFRGDMVGKKKQQRKNKKSTDFVPSSRVYGTDLVKVGREGGSSSALNLL